MFHEIYNIWITLSVTYTSANSKVECGKQARSSQCTMVVSSYRRMIARARALRALARSLAHTLSFINQKAESIIRQIVVFERFSRCHLLLLSPSVLCGRNLTRSKAYCYVADTNWTCSSCILSVAVFDIAQLGRCGCSLARVLPIGCRLAFDQCTWPRRARYKGYDIDRAQI